MKNPRTLSDVAPGARQRLHDCFTLKLFHRHRRWNNKGGIEAARAFKLLRQAFRQQLISGTEHHGTFDDALEFADVTGPIVLPQA